ncbi:oxidoreductase [Paenibacillus sp. VMFN-D1]|uniref:oxidoreductase n=1 Tax=Paenibacillus sp. VMFN-D1 TaxID=2135608 RepID=UPI000E22025B|nr:oxidoreductase [Paenibacillus sp. VMFN-D1]RED37380.1 NADP-dependent 3-hydroxy acid dehydrogenase YdfG [Paenibacillus sp. VMFN-D1]
MQKQSNPVWLITGTSSGVGRVLAEAVLNHGHRVVLTARNPEALKELAEQYPDSTHVAALDVTNSKQILEVVDEAERKFGGIDILVNNAGIGYSSAIEEGEEADIRSLFDTNFFGLASMIRAVLPGMRARKQGTIVNISSNSGVVAMPSLGYYSASKFAVEGLTEALWQEVEPLGIKVLLIEPGGMRTGIMSKNRRSVRNPAYDETSGAVKDLLEKHGDSLLAGDPERIAQVIIKMVEKEDKPHRLILGNAAYDQIMDKIDNLKAEYRAWRSVSRSTDFPEK